MTWVAAFLLAVVAFLVLAFVLKAPRKGWEAIGADASGGVHAVWLDHRRMAARSGPVSMKTGSSGCLARATRCTARCSSTLIDAGGSSKT